MTFVDRVTELLKERGISKKQMLIDCGMGKNSFVTWKNGVVPNASTLTVLANYFGVTNDYLIGKTDERKAPEKELEGLTSPFREKSKPFPKMKNKTSWTTFVLRSSRRRDDN